MLLNVSENVPVKEELSPTPSTTNPVTLKLAVVLVPLWSRLKGERPPGLLADTNAGFVGVQCMTPAQVVDCVSVPSGIDVNVSVILPVVAFPALSNVIQSGMLNVVPKGAVASLMLRI